MINEFEKLNWEIVHHYESDGGDYIVSRSNKFEIFKSNRLYSFSLPMKHLFAIPNAFRLARRLLRLDKSSAVFNFEGDGVSILYAGNIWFFDLESEEVKKVDELRQCRNTLHRGMAVSQDGIFFGEYGPNPDRVTVPIWRSTDGGRNWNVIYEFVAGMTKHIHGIYHDPFTDRYWVATGDFDGECHMLNANADFSDVEILGDGTQKWRPVSMFFDADKVVWAMDSPIDPSLLQVFDRKTKILTAGTRFPGPVWYTKSLTDGTHLLQSSAEPGPSVISDKAHVYSSRDLLNWEEVYSFKKDIWPTRYFKYGVVSFADGDQSPQDFVMHGEGLVDFDGRAGKFWFMEDPTVKLESDVL